MFKIGLYRYTSLVYIGVQNTLKKVCLGRIIKLIRNSPYFNFDADCPSLWVNERCDTCASDGSTATSKEAEKVLLL